MKNTRREFYGKNFQIRIVNRERVGKLTFLTKRIWNITTYISHKNASNRRKFPRPSFPRPFFPTFRKSFENSITMKCVRTVLYSVYCCAVSSLLIRFSSKNSQTLSCVLLVHISYIYIARGFRWASMGIEVDIRKEKSSVASVVIREQHYSKMAVISCARLHRKKMLTRIAWTRVLLMHGNFAYLSITANVKRMLESVRLRFARSRATKAKLLCFNRFDLICE